MNYENKIKILRKEISQMLQYRHMDTSKRVCALIGMIPFWIVTACGILGYYALLFIYTGLESSATYLEEWLKEMKKDTRHATEAVVYWVILPAILAFRVFLSIFSMFFYILWFFLMVVSYITTLGGIHWTPFIGNVNDEETTSYVATTKRTMAHTYAILVLLLFSIFVAMKLFGVLMEELEVYKILDEVKDITTYIMYAYIGFPFVAVPFVFKKTVKNSSEYEDVFSSSTETFVSVSTGFSDDIPDF